jgi:hypothetical protein
MEATESLKCHYELTRDTGLQFFSLAFPLTRSHHEALKLVLEIPKENGRGKHQNKMS